MTMLRCEIPYRVSFNKGLIIPKAFYISENEEYIVFRCMVKSIEFIINKKKFEYASELMK